MKLLTLREARERRRWTQEQLEAASGVDQGVISRLERGESVNPTFETVRKLEAALRLRRGTLVFGQVMEKSA
ncbi:MAG TPA: helix-turn-helix transcriptional regulator [Prosthecobacter sp.]|nr:helix-turn-helix transcriptional regulator [Prosthecobacter sp.]